MCNGLTTVRPRNEVTLSPCACTVLGVRPATQRENCASARLCSFLSVLLHCCSEKSLVNQCVPHGCKECCD